MQNSTAAFNSLRGGTTRRTFCLGALAAGRPRPSHAAQTVFSADAFVESVGVCTHLASPPYRDRFERVATLAGSLGIRHLRDDLRPDDDRDRWRALYRRFGIRRHLLVSPTTNTVSEMHDYIRAVGTDAVSAIEGQNEGDSDWFMGQKQAKPDWATAVTDYQRALFTAVRERYPPQALPVLSPTVLDYKPADMRALAAAAPYCDMVAVHPYVQRGEEPETDRPYAALPWYLQEFCRPFKPGAPVMATEAGYHGAVGLGRSGVSGTAAAKYVPRLLLHAFSLGLVRTFLYELMDEGKDPADPEHNYGLVSEEADPKPAYLTLQLLLQSLADPGPAFSPDPVAVRVTGSAADLRSLAFAKRSKEVWVALWRAARSWDINAKRDVTVSPTSVRVSLSRPFPSAASLVLGSDRGWTERTQAGGTVELEVDDGVTLVRLAA